MTSSGRQRVLELLADRASVGLGEAETAELEALLAQDPQLVDLDDDSFELAAAAAAIAMNGKSDPLDTALRQRVIDDAARWYGRTKEPRGRWIALPLFVVGCLAIGAIGGWATTSSVNTWYPGLAKPSWNPPNSIFGPVWTLLYITVAVAAWLVWRRRKDRDVRSAMVLFGVQLALNCAWSVIFFGLQQPGFAAFEIVLLLCSIAAMVWVFARISRMAAALLVPYLGWVAFAAALNFAIWRLNL